MPRTLFVAGAVSAGLLATGVVVPAEAATTPVFKHCTKTVNGVELRVKMRFDDRILRVRLSHPDGTGNFQERRIQRVAATLISEGEAVPPDGNGAEIGGAAWAQRYGDRPVLRTRNFGAVNTAVVTFTLKNGKRATVDCTQRF